MAEFIGEDGDFFAIASRVLIAGYLGCYLSYHTNNLWFYILLYMLVQHVLSCKGLLVFVVVVF